MTINTARERDLEAGRYAGAQIHTLLWERHVTKAEAAAALDMSPSTFGKKLRGLVPLSVDELVGLARLLKVEPGTLLPRLDSNQQPFGYLLMQVRHVGRVVARLLGWPPVQRPPAPAPVVDLGIYRARRAA